MFTTPSHMASLSTTSPILPATKIYCRKTGFACLSAHVAENW